MTYEDFNAHSKLVDKLEEGVPGIEEFIRRYLSNSATCAALSAASPPTPLVSLIKKAQQ